jgi:hypothetical protein
MPSAVTSHRREQLAAPSKARVPAPKLKLKPGDTLITKRLRSGSCLTSLQNSRTRELSAATLRRDLPACGWPGPYQRSADATRPGDNTPRIMPTTGPVSHTEPGDRGVRGWGRSKGNGPIQPARWMAIEAYRISAPPRTDWLNASTSSATHRSREGALDPVQNEDGSRSHLPRGCDSWNRV